MATLEAAKAAVHPTLSLLNTAIVKSQPRSVKMQTS